MWVSRDIETVESCPERVEKRHDSIVEIVVANIQYTELGGMGAQLLKQDHGDTCSQHVVGEHKSLELIEASAWPFLDF